MSENKNGIKQTNCKVDIKCYIPLPNSLGVQKFNVRIYKPLPVIERNEFLGNDGIIAKLKHEASINIEKQVNDEIIRHYIKIAKKMDIDELILMDEEKCKQFIMWAIAKYKNDKETADEQMKMYAELFGYELRPNNKQMTAVEIDGNQLIKGEKWLEK